jgi:hypothetical protein
MEGQVLGGGGVASGQIHPGSGGSPHRPHTPRLIDSAV